MGTSRLSAVRRGRASSLLGLTSLLGLLFGVSMERAARAQDRAPAAAPPARLLRTLCERPAERADDEEPAEAPHCHMLSFPAFVPSALMASYVGVRIGGGFQSASFQPFSTIDGSYTRALGSGALELSKEVIAERVAVLGSLSGGVATGANAGTLLGGGASLGGGVDVGLAVGRPVGGAGQIALIGRVTQRNGTTLVVERALTALPQNPINQKVVDVAGFLGTAAGRIAVPYRESGQRLDAAWALAATPLVSVQLAIGIEHRYRYYRSDDPSAAGNLREIAAPRFGVAVGVDLSSNLCGSRCVPLAFLLEYQLSPACITRAIGTPTSTPRSRRTLTSTSRRSSRSIRAPVWFRHAPGNSARRRWRGISGEDAVAALGKSLRPEFALDARAARSVPEKEWLTPSVHRLPAARRIPAG
jgi:hypothetical protein